MSGLSRPSLAPFTPGPSLMSRPQPLGLVPTLWFWREVTGHSPALDVGLGLVLGVVSVVLVQAVVLAGAALPLAVAVSLLAPYLALGALEHGLRRLVVRRRRALPAS